MESSEGFYVQLTSFERVSDRFVARLPYALSFANRWMCALVEAIVIKPSIDVNEENAVVITKAGGHIRGYRLEPGRYADGAALVAEINKAIEKNRKLPTGFVEQLKQRFTDLDAFLPTVYATDTHTKRQALDLDERTQTWLPPSLRHHLETSEIDICADIVIDSIVDQSTKPLLQTIFAPRQLTHVRYDTPHYVSLATHHFDKVHITMLGQPRLLKLHFRPERYHLSI